MNGIIESFGNFAEMLSSRGISPGVVSLAISAPFLILSLILIPVFMFKGFKRGSIRAAISLGFTAAAGFLAVLASKVTSLFFASKVTIWANNVLSQVRPEDVNFDFQEKLPYMTAFLGGIFKALISMLLYGIFLFIFIMVIKIVSNILLKGLFLFSRKPLGSRIGGMVLGLLDGLLLALLFCVPLYTVLESGFSSVEAFTDPSVEIVENSSNDEHNKNGENINNDENSVDKEALEEAKKEVHQFAKSVNKNPLLKLSSVAPFNFTDRFFFSFSCKGETYYVWDILKDGGEIVTGALNTVGKPIENYGESEQELLNHLLETAEKNHYFYGIISDMTALTREFLHPSLEGGEASKGDYVYRILDLLSSSLENCSLAEIEESAKAIVKVLDSAIENRVIQNYQDVGAMLEALANTTFIDDSVGSLRSVPRLSGAADELLLISIDFLDFSDGESDNKEFEKLKEKIRSNIENNQLDRAKELAALKEAIAGISGLYNTTDGFNPDKLDFQTISAVYLSQALCGIGRHPYFAASGTKLLVTTVLSSFGGKIQSTFTEEFLEKATEALEKDINAPLSEQGRLENLLLSTQSLYVAVNQMSKGTVLQNKEALEKSVDVILSTMTTESAEVLSEILTEEILTDMEVKPEAAGQVSNVVSSLLDHATKTEGLSEEQMKTEKEAFTKMGTLVTTAKDSVNGNTSEDGKTSIETAVGDLDGFVNTVAHSSVVMNTVKELLEKNGQKGDPTGMFANMGEVDKNAVLNSCRKLVNENPSDTVLLKNIETLCHFMGVSFVK